MACLSNPDVSIRGVSWFRLNEHGNIGISMIHGLPKALRDAGKMNSCIAEIK